MIRIVTYILSLLLLFEDLVLADDQCFTFSGDSYLVFSPPSEFDNKDKVHYEMRFRTTALNGVLMYARGVDGDAEALYIRGGNLHYHLFNVAPSGVGGQFGGAYVSEEQVNNNVWITVHLYRSYPVRQMFRASRNKTGIEFVLNGKKRSYVDYLDRSGIDISNSIYFGGYSSSLSATVGNFTGEIAGITEEKNAYTFENPSLNYKSLVELQCEN